MKKGWQTAPFDSVIADESSGNIKTPQNEFLASGHFAVVDQGKELIAGYVTDKSRLCRARLPVIIFGDHTRCFKYIDFPFCMGADGVKVLRPKNDADIKYLYHYFRQLRLPDGGYDRHFKYLKRVEVILPPVAEQQRIAEILDRTDALRAKRRAAITQLDTLAHAIFIDMFGDPVANTKRWPTFPFRELCSRVTVGIVVRPASYYVTKGVPALRSLNIRPGAIDLSNLVYFSKTDNDTKLAKTKLYAGDIVLVRTGQPGTAAIIPNELNGVNAIDLLITTPIHEKCDATFLCFFFNSAGGRRIVLESQRGQVQKHLNVGSLNTAVIPLPPLAAQRDFALRILKIEKVRAAQMASMAELDALFASLQHRAFRGEL